MSAIPKPKHAERGAHASLHSTSCFPLIQHCSPAFDDPFDLFGRVTSYAPHSFFMEHDAVQEGVARRFSYLGCDPYRVVRGKGHTYETVSVDKKEKHIGDPFALLQRTFVGKTAGSGQQFPPFQGGAIGCFSYDLARMFEVLPERLQDDLHFPDLYFLFVEIFVVVDHQAPGPGWSLRLHQSDWPVKAGITYLAKDRHACLICKPK